MPRSSHFGAERLHLLGDLRADVVARRPRAEAPRGRDRLQAGDAGAEHEHLRRRDRARRGHQHRVEARRVLGAEQRRLVAGHVRLRRQRVHRLRAADPRDRLHRERRAPSRRRARASSRATSAAPGSRRGAAVAELGDLVLRRRRDLDDHVGAPRVADRRAPASSNSSSGISAASPAPASTTTSTPFAPRRLTTSGTSATRRSPSAVSLGTPTIIGGGKVSERPRRSRSAAAVRPLPPRRANRERPPRQAGQRLRGDPDRCLGARARVADAAVRGDERAQVRRAASRDPPRRTRAGVPPGRDQPLDGPGGRLRVRRPPGLQREPAVGVLVARMNPAARATAPRRDRPPRRAPGARRRCRRCRSAPRARRSSSRRRGSAGRRATTPPGGRSRRASSRPAARSARMANAVRLTRRSNDPSERRRRVSVARRLTPARAPRRAARRDEGEDRALDVAGVARRAARSPRGSVPVAGDGRRPTAARPIAAHAV